MRFRDRLAVSGVDWTLYVPWFNRRQPFVSLHVLKHGSEIHRGRHRNVWHIGVGCGRTFTDTGRGFWRWFDVKGRWRT